MFTYPVGLMTPQDVGGNHFSSSDINAFDSDMVSAYNMETTACLDSHGAFDATSTNQLATSTGKENNALVPSSTSPDAEFASNAFVNTLGNYAISCWVKSDGSSAVGYVLAHYDDANNQAPITILVTPSTDTVKFELETSAGGAAGITSTNLTSGSYHHLLCTVQGTTHQAYLNGASLGTATITGTRRTGDIPRLFCRDFGTGNNSFSQGVDLDALYMWSNITFGGGKPSEADFVAANYNSGSGDFYS